MNKTLLGSTARSEFLVRQPDYVDLLDRMDLLTNTDFLSLQEEIISGHPDRQVSRVQLDGMAAYLKREHVVPWKERLRNWWAGFGWASKSWREAQMLAQLDATSIGHPQWIAAGEDEQGRAFVLLRALDSAVSLPEALQDGGVCPQRLGEALAELHNEGFDHPDLYAGHVFVDRETQQISFIDWQRARHGSSLSPVQRWRSLAALHATLPDGGVALEWRLNCLTSYLEHAGWPSMFLSCVVAQIETRARELRGRRHIRTKSARTDAPASTLLLLDQGRLWVTQEGHRLWPYTIPVSNWLAARGQSTIKLTSGHNGMLTTQCRRPRWWERRPWTSPERKQMSLLFRLERLGIEAPRVLAVGEYPRDDGSITCFLLTRLPGGCSQLPAVCPSADQLLGQLASAGFETPARNCLAWQSSHARPVLLDVTGLRLRSRGLSDRLGSPRRTAA